MQHLKCLRTHARRGFICHAWVCIFQLREASVQWPYMVWRGVSREVQLGWPPASSKSISSQEEMTASAPELTKVLLSAVNKSLVTAY